MAALNGNRSTDLSISPYRRLEGELFRMVTDRTGLSDQELAIRLGNALGRPALVAATVRGWRSGDHPVPMPAFLAACDLAHLRFGGPEVQKALDGFRAGRPKNGS